MISHPCCPVRTALRSLLFIATIAVSLPGLFAQSDAGSINGKVIDSRTKAPLSGALVTLVNANREVAVGRDGEFYLGNVPAGSYTLQTSYIGYPSQTTSVNVLPGQRATLEVTLGETVVELEAFTVEGRRTGQARAINQQRASENLKNIVSSDAFGQFPDQNAAEALQRVPSVSIERDQGEGRYVVIRGIDPELNNISVNGVALTSPEGDTRKVAMDTVPSELLAQLEITKTVLPDQDGDAIGGAVNIRTASAFDSSGRTLQGGVQAHYNSLVEKYSYKYHGTYGDVFGPNKNIGFIISGSWQNRELGSSNVEGETPWQFPTAAQQAAGAPAILYFPQIQFRDYILERKRYGFSSALEFKPDADSLYYVRGLWNFFSDVEWRSRTRVQFNQSNLANPFTNLTQTSATVADTRRTIHEVKERLQEQTLWNVVVGGEKRIGDWELDSGVSFSTGQEDQPYSDTVAFRNQGARYTYTYEFNDFYIPRVTQSPTANSDFNPANLGFNNSRLRPALSEEEEWALHANAKREIAIGTGSFLKFGVKYRAKTKKYDDEIIDSTLIPSGLNMAQFAAFSPTYPFFGGPAGVGPDRFLRTDLHSPQAYVRQNYSAFGFARNVELSTVSDYKSDEDVLAGYLMASSTWGSLNLIAGVRIEQTEFSSKGFDYNANTQAVTSLSASKDYTNILPGIHARWAPNKRAVVRGSINSTLARPKFSDSALRRTTDTIDATISTGNPALDPYESWNYDVSFEYYPASLGVFSAGLFHKEIDDFIFTEVSSQNIDGTLFRVSRPLNAESASISGLELAWQQQFTKLPSPFDGLGFYGNLTLTDSKSKTSTRPGLEFPLLKQSETIGNVAISYEKYGIFLRVAGSYRSSYLDIIGDDPFSDEYIDDYFQIDISANYKVNRHLQLLAEVNNVTDTPTRAYFGSNRPRQYEEYGWTANFGVKVSY